MKQPTILSVSFLLFVGASGFSIPSQTIHSRVESSGLFQRRLGPLAASNSQASSLFRSSNVDRVAKSRNLASRPLRWLRAMRRASAIVCASLLFWVGAAMFNTSASHASTEAAPAPPSATQSRNVVTSRIDRLIDGYVKKHMFDDDVYDPVESTYKEATLDKLQGAHPKAISEITSSILGQDGLKADKKESGSGIGGALLGSITFLQRRGLSESTAILLLAGSFVVAGPIAFVTVGMMVGNQSKRQINSVMKRRYGDTYTVDATVKVEDDVEPPDDDDDEDDDEEDDEDDDDDDDEEK
eukprot:scaffold11032_cov122-Cylindrotheca_fusiformis.AAC.22